MTIAEWLKIASTELANAMTPSARLDAEIILAHTLGKSRAWLHAHAEDELDDRRREIAEARIELRLERVPVAYIIGHKEFYGRRFFVSPAVLIPRPESEALIELLNDWLSQNNAKHLVDVGTGSGCLGITAKLEHPNLDVTLIDSDSAALAVARRNIAAYQVDIRTLESDLLDAYPLRADIIIANLPYVDPGWPVSEDTKHEPAQALFATDNGLELVKTLLKQASSQLANDGIIILEADQRQHDVIRDYAARLGFQMTRTRGLGLVLELSPDKPLA